MAVWMRHIHRLDWLPAAPASQVHAWWLTNYCTSPNCACTGIYTFKNESDFPTKDVHHLRSAAAQALLSSQTQNGILSCLTLSTFAYVCRMTDKDGGGQELCSKAIKQVLHR